ncbi:MAG: HAD family hydrolase [Betaproteobacteria bacterium]|nr:HAD family hydrolase [Betaproteobacteria bacterium]
MQAVFLDACGVLYRRQRRYRYLLAFLRRRRLPVPTPAELQGIRERIKRQVPAADRDARYDAFLLALSVSDPASRADGRRVLWQEAGEISLFPEVPETLRTLKARGFKLGVITNTTRTSLQKRRWLENSGIDVPFDSFIASCEVGVAKPHQRIYELALAQCQVSPGASLFVGHEETELMGARAVGMKTIAFGSAAEAGDEYIARFAELLELPYLQSPSRAGSVWTSRRLANAPLIR